MKEDEGWIPVCDVHFEPGIRLFSQTQVQSNFATPNKVAYEIMIQDAPCQSFTPSETDSYLGLIKSASTTK